jgi:phage gp16-like protein
MATPKQIKLIHCVSGALGLSDDDYRDVLSGYGATSSKDLDTVQAARMLADLEEKAASAGVWKRGGAPKRAGRRPHNLDAGRNSRQAQLQKIEALLTVGGKPWGYADALAARICKVETLAWVPAEELYKIITALRKQAQREGWDLSGEG